MFGKKGDLCRLSIFDSNAVSKLLLANIPPSPLFPLFPVLTKNDYVMNVTVTHQDSATSVLAIEIQRARSYRNLHDNMFSIYKTIWEIPNLIFIFGNFFQTSDVSGGAL